MRTAAICPTCSTYENAVCVIYNGDTLYNINVPPMTDLQSALGFIDASVASVTALINNLAANPFFLTTEGTTNLATLSGNVLNIPTYEPTLQEVTTYGNTTDQDIVVANIAGTSALTVRANSVEIKNITTDTYTYLTHTQLYRYDSSLGQSIINLPDPANNATFDFPSTGGTLVVSVNGETADSAGNVTISTGGTTMTIKRTLTSAEILALNATPISLVTATSGNTIVPISAYFKLNNNTTAYSGGSILIYITATDGDVVGYNQSIASFNVSNSQDVMQKINCNFSLSQTSPMVISDNEVYLYAPLVLTLGDGTVDVYFTYAEL